MNELKNPPSKPRARVHNRDRHAEILAAARTVFIEQGFDAATTAEIARRANVAEGTIYRYAKTKRILLEQAIKGWYGEMSAQMADGIAKCPTTKEKLAFAIQQHFKVFSDHGAIAQLMVREMRAKVVGQRGEVDEMNRTYTRFLLDLLIAGQAEGTIRMDLKLPLARDIFFGTIEHSAMRMKSSADAQDDVAAFTAEFWAIVSK